MWSEFFSNRDWPLASAVAILLLLILVVPIVIYRDVEARRLRRRRPDEPRRRLSVFNVTSLALGFAFLYLPILLLVVYSFNDSRLVTVWGGFSTQWYGALFRNEALMDAAWVTLRIALLSATPRDPARHARGARAHAVRPLPGRTLFTGMVYAPMVMPEVITGLVAAAVLRRASASTAAS